MIQAFWNDNDERPFDFSVLKFSGGEIQVRIRDTKAEIGRSRLKGYETLTIRAHLTSSDEIMTLILLVDAIERLFPVRSDRPPLHLLCPYLPYARQDRVCAPGEALALGRMCDMINGLRFDSVTVWDVHSDTSLALLNNCINVPPEHLMPRILGSNDVLVAPDAGALKKVQKVAKWFKVPMITAEKMRSVEDGSITGTKVHSEHIGDKDFWIVDDICDGGRTFTELAKELKPLTNGKIFLYVTHGIFSKGFEPFKGLIHHIWSAAIFPGVDNADPILTPTRKL